MLGKVVKALAAGALAMAVFVLACVGTLFITYYVLTAPRSLIVWTGAVAIAAGLALFTGAYIADRPYKPRHTRRRVFRRRARREVDNQT